MSFLDPSMPKKSEQILRLPPGQQWVAPGKWPVIGEREPGPGEPQWTLTITGNVDHPCTFSIDELNSMPASRVKMDVHCVTRWSMPDVEFEGVLLSKILQSAGVKPDSAFVSFVARSARSHSTSLELQTALDLDTLIATRVNGNPIPPGHGGPIRNIVRGRYFYKSVKWLSRIEVLTRDRLGFWEAESGYHNIADPWQQQRYMAPDIDRRAAAKLIESRDFSSHDLRSIQLTNMNLDGLQARNSLLRDARFEDASLIKANFAGANLSNSHFDGANLQDARFVGADLEGASFSGADLRGADFSGSFLTAASFCEIDAGGTITSPAHFDETTIMSHELLAPLTPAQAEFVRNKTSP